LTANEEWRPVVGWEMAYEVSSLGRVRRISGKDCRNRTWQGRILKPRINKSGRPMVCLSYKTSKTALVHTLVCEAFHGPRPDGYETAHNDGDPSNNSAQNLRWATRSENEADKIKHGTIPVGERNGRHTKPWRTARGERANKSALTDCDVLAIRALSIGGMSQNVLSQKFGVTRTTIQCIQQRKTWRHI